MSSSASPEKPVSKTSFVCPVSVISSIFSLEKDELQFLEAAKSNDIETVNTFIEEKKYFKGSEDEEFRIIFLTDTAAILSIHQGNEDVTRLLLSRGFIIREPHSRSCQCKECCSLGVLLKALSRLNTYQVMSNPTYLSYCFFYANPSGSSELLSEDVDNFRSKLDPIYRAFELNGKLEQLAVAEYEFKKEYRALSNQCEEYAVQLLNLCQNMKEIACVMSMPNGKEVRWLEEGATDLSVLNFAIKNKNERFVAHPYSQLMLNSVVYRDLHGWQYRSLLTKSVAAVIFTILLPFWCLFYLITPQNALNKMLKVPLAKFLGNVISFLWFLGLLIWSSLGDTYGETITEISVANFLVSLWVLGMILEEIKEYLRQGSQRYFSQWWNVVTIIMLILFVLAGLLWFMGQGALDENHAKSALHKHYALHLFSEISKEWAFKCMLLSDSFYAVAFILSFLHISSALQVNSTIGPLHLSLVQMCGDVTKFLLLFSIFYFAFGLALREVYSQFVLVSSIPYLNSSSPATHKFSHVSSSFGNLFWALFDKTDLDAFYIGRPEFRITELTGEILFAVYNITAILVALNMLIAMMANSFQKVADDADIQWKFSRTRMWMQYVDKGSDVPPPFNLIPNWKAIVSCVKWFCKKKDIKYEEIGDKTRIIDDGHRKAIIINLVNRYFVKAAERASGTPTHPVGTI